MRISDAVRAVLRAFLDAEGHCFGYRIMQEADLPASTVYPILRRLVKNEWATECDHGPDPEQQPGRPARKCYELTELGVAEARKALGET